MNVAKKVIIVFMTVFKSKQEEFKISKAISKMLSGLFGNKEEELLNSALVINKDKVSQWVDNLKK